MAEPLINTSSGHIGRDDRYFHKLFGHSYSGVSLLDKDLRLIYRSPSAFRITGWSNDEVMERAFHSFIHPDDQSVVTKMIAETISQPGGTFVCDFRMQHRLGHRLWLQCTFSNLLHEPGIEAIVVNFTLRDSVGDQVTATGSSFSEGRQTEAQRNLIAGVSSAFHEHGQIKDIHHMIIDRLLRFSGGKEATIWMQSLCGLELIQRTSNSGQAASPNAEALARQVWTEGRSIVDERNFLGLPLHYREALFGVLTLDFGLHHNIDEQDPFWDTLTRILGIELRHQQTSEQLRLLVEKAPDIIGIVGSDRYFKQVNPAMSRLLGFTEEELLSRSLDLLVHPEDLAASQTRTREFLQGGDQTMYFENRFVTKTGKGLWLSWTVSRSAEEGLLYCVGKNISDKKDMENLLDKANALARIGGWEVDLVRGTAYWSPITKEIYEVPENFVPGADNWLSFYREGHDRNYIGRKMADVIATGTSCDIEVQMLTARGTLRWVRAIAEAEFVDGKCVRAYGSFQDIDSRKKAELAATAALKERDKILESIGDGFFAVDRNWIVTYWNVAAEKVLGRTRTEMLGQHLWDQYPDVRKLGFYRKYHKAMKSGKAIHFEDYYPEMGIWFSVGAYPSESGLSVFFKDITDSKRATKALAESEKRYSDLFQLSPQPMFVYEMSTLRYLDVNLAAVEHYGYSRDEFLSMTIRDIRPEEDLPLLQQTVAEKQNEIRVDLEGIFRHRKKSGEIIRVDIHSNIITFHGVKCKVVLANDVTERVHYVEAIEMQNEKLREISWMQSHVIRAPLCRIMALLPMLHCPVDDAEQQQIYDFLISSANELDEKIRTITDVTKVVSVK